MEEPKKEGEIVPQPNNPESGTPEPKAKEPEVDYKALLEQEKKARARAEYALRHKDDSKPMDGIDDEGQPITRKELKELLIQQSVQISGQINKTEDKQLVRSKTKSEDEAKLVEYYLQNRIVPSGDREADVEDAVAMANKHRILSVAKEIKIAKESKENLGSGVGAGQKPEIKQPLDLPPEATKFLNSPIAKKYGITPEQYKAMLEKNSRF